jgi:high-affinity nickel-transport protein
LNPVRGWRWWQFSPTERGRLAVFYGVVALLHVCGWGVLLFYARRSASLVGIGFAAYMFGLRHAFDADHIVAVDDTVRFLMQRGQRPLGIGFFFSLGHATIVFVLTLATVLVAALVRARLPALQDAGGVIGTTISGAFLWLIGILNLLVLLDILKVWHGRRRARPDHQTLEKLLAGRGFFNRLWGGRLQRLVRNSWQMYPLGMLFGLGFDTTSEVGLLVMAASASAGNSPALAVLSLPVLFAAGMSAMDTTDGVLMSKAYEWAFVNPLRKIYYNITITALSVAVALVIGTIEWLQVLSRTLHLGSPFFRLIAALDFALLGYLLVGMFVFAWAVSVLWWWRFARAEER